MTRERLAIIGTGISGMACAHFLQDQYELTLYEKGDYIGGHTHTVYVEEPGRSIAVDTGFIVFNETNYPYLSRLFEQLGIPSTNTNMSFSVRHDPLGLEYCGSGVRGLFCQRANLFRPQFYRMLMAVHKFNRLAPEVLSSPALHEMTVEEYFNYRHIHHDALEQFLIPMSSALWSAPQSQIRQFPILTLVRFFSNHGMLGLHAGLQWKTVSGGSWNYRDHLIAPFRDRIRLNSEVVSLSKLDGSIVICTDQGEETFDKVILACHADEALKLLAQPSAIESELLGCFQYNLNQVMLHTDAAVMPARRTAWSSWNYRIADHDENAPPMVNYYMNRLQPLETHKDYFVSLNSAQFIRPELIVKSIDYHHPIFDLAAITAQERLPELNQQQQGIYYCGSYFRYGFHEDALWSAVQVCKQILKRVFLL